MSNFQPGNSSDIGFAAGKSLHTFAPVALALVGMFSGKSLADDGKLQFEKVSPRQVSSQSAPAAKAPAVPAARPAARQDASATPGQRASVPGVSAVAYGLARGAKAPGEAVTHSESELRGIFRRAVEQAAERSPNVKRALAEQSASLADVDEAKGQRLPQIDVGTRSKSVELGGKSGHANGQSVNIDIVTPVFDWGRIRKTIESRSHLASAADSALQAELEASAFEVTSDLVELGKQRIIVDISQKFVDRMAELVKMLEGIVAVDTGRVSELTQARARLLQAEASRSTAESRARDIEIDLRKKIGERPLPPLPRSAYWQMHLPDLEHLLAQSASHPVIKQAQAQARSADLQAEVVRSSSLPQLNWVVGKTTGEDALGREPAWQTSLSMSWSAFRGGSTRAAERAARQRAEASRQNTEQQVLDLEYRIRAANHDAQTLLERADLYRSLSAESDKVRKAFYEQWHHLGRRTLLDVLISENDHYNNQVGEITNRFDGYAAIVRQYASSGTLVGWLSAGR
ncbi:TolC family protein [Pseudomonas citronellolis]|uniref:TolC family protein n=1 Tax=Pseudomonas citronellolis TaxID=53408 RepID=UPI00248E5FC1|nr:TolC family protein [Pseudomonas citronellolis]